MPQLLSEMQQRDVICLPLVRACVRSFVRVPACVRACVRAANLDWDADANALF